ncbi:hypothetical protein JOL62DRAFT_3634 [Phyllosticta paracitricarpa]|uniref:Uncharacterized protein n=1 Tax=Phyllosticta paracitricarpa TaxID=2016321 RepID=A0ABR1NJM4_9PEZI
MYVVGTILMVWEGSRCNGSNCQVPAYDVQQTRNDAVNGERHPSCTRPQEPQPAMTRRSSSHYVTSGHPHQYNRRCSIHSFIHSFNCLSTNRPYITRQFDSADGAGLFASAYTIHTKISHRQTPSHRSRFLCSHELPNSTATRPATKQSRLANLCRSRNLTHPNNQSTVSQSTPSL